VPSVAAVTNNARSNLVRGDGRFGRLPLDNPLTEFVKRPSFVLQKEPGCKHRRHRQGEGKKRRPKKTKHNRVLVQNTLTVLLEDRVTGRIAQTGGHTQSGVGPVHVIFRTWHCKQPPAAAHCSANLPASRRAPIGKKKTTAENSASNVIYRCMLR
jgi:hypothetical protein